MSGGFGMRKGGSRVREIVPRIIHGQLIFKGPNYKKPCMKVGHCESCGPHQYLKVLPDQEWWAELCCSQAAVSRTAIGFLPSTNPCYLTYPVPLLADMSFFLLASRLVCSHALSHHYEPSWRFFLIVFFHVESNLMRSLRVNMCEALLISVEIIDSFQPNKTAEQKQVGSVLQSRSCDLNTSLGQLVNSSSPVTPVLLAKLSAGYIWK